MEALSYCIDTSFHSLLLCLQALFGVGRRGVFQSLQMIVRNAPTGWLATKKNTFFLGVLVQSISILMSYVVLLTVKFTSYPHRINIF